MAITIPSQSPVSSGPTLQGVSPGDAMAPGLALGRVAQSVGKAAKVLAEHDARIQKVQNAADLTEIKTKMKATYADFRLGLAEDHDYKGYSEKWDKELESLQKGIVEGQYSQAVIDEANRQFTAFQGDTRIGVAAAAQNKAVERAKQAYANGFQMAVDAYDPANPSTADFNEHLESQTWMTPEEKESQNELYRERIKRKQTFAEIHEDPRGWLEDNSKQPKEGVAFWDDSRRRAKARLNELVSEQSLMVINGVLNGKIEVDDVEALTPDLDAKDRLELSALLAARTKAYAEASLSESEREDREFLKAAEKEDAYKEISSEIATMLFTPGRAGNPTKKQKDWKKQAEAIRDSGLDPRAQAKLLDMLIDVRANDYANAEETYHSGIFWKRERDITQKERGTIEKTMKLFEMSLEIQGYRNSLHEELLKADNLINEFYTKNDDPSQSEIEAFESRILQPVYDRIGHYTILGR